MLTEHHYLFFKKWSIVRRSIEMYLIALLRQHRPAFAGNAVNDNGSAMGPVPGFATIAGEIYITFMYLST